MNTEKLQCRSRTVQDTRGVVAADDRAPTDQQRGCSLGDDFKFYSYIFPINPIYHFSVGVKMSELKKKDPWRKN